MIPGFRLIALRATLSIVGQYQHICMAHGTFELHGYSLKVLVLVLFLEAADHYCLYIVAE